MLRLGLLSQIGGGMRCVFGSCCVADGWCWGWWCGRRWRRMSRCIISRSGGAPGGMGAGLTVNPTDGSLWACMGDSVFHYDANHNLLSKTELWWPQSPCVNPNDGSCWVAEYGAGVSYFHAERRPGAVGLGRDGAPATLGVHTAGPSPLHRAGRVAVGGRQRELEADLGYRAGARHGSRWRGAGLLRRQSGGRHVLGYDGLLRGDVGAGAGPPRNGRHGPVAGGLSQWVRRQARASPVSW